jgi:hypothetical protein
MWPLLHGHADRSPYEQTDGRTLAFVRRLRRDLRQGPAEARRDMEEPVTIGYPTCCACDKPGEWLVTHRDTHEIVHVCREHRTLAGPPRRTDIRETVKR